MANKRPDDSLNSWLWVEIRKFLSITGNISAKDAIIQAERAYALARDRYRPIVEGLVETINTTGGVRRNRKNEPCPVGDEDWVDLGNIYLSACAALDQKPKEAVDGKEESEPVDGVPGEKDGD